MLGQQEYKPLSHRACTPEYTTFLSREVCSLGRIHRVACSEPVAGLPFVSQTVILSLNVID